MKRCTRRIGAAFLGTCGQTEALLRTSGAVAVLKMEWACDVL